MTHDESIEGQISGHDSVADIKNRDFLNSNPVVYHRYLNRAVKKFEPQEKDHGQLHPYPNMFHLLKQPNRIPNRNALMCKMFNYTHPKCWPKKRYDFVLPGFIKHHEAY